jgi:hypothetical protein
MKIVEFRSENIKKIKVVRIKPDGSMVQITGRNGSGKTSVLDAISFALEGLEGAPTHIIRKGAKEGFVDLDIGEFRISRTFTEAGTNLVVKDKAGSRIAGPQAVLNKLMSHLGFDPFEFMRMKPKLQADHLRTLVKLDLEAIDAAIEKEQLERRDVRRDLRTIKAQLEEMEAPLADLPPAPLDVRAIADKLQVAIQHNAAVEVAQKQVEEMKRNAKTAEDNAAARRAHITQLQQQIKEDEAAEKKAMQEAETWRTQAQRISVHKTEDTAALSEEIKNAEATNAQIRKRDEYRSLDTRRSSLEVQDKDLGTSIATAEENKAKAIANAKFPIKGLAFEGGEVMYGGLPLAQASSAEQLRVSTAIAMAANPKLRVIRISDGSLLDPDSLELLRKMAEADDYQIWIERVDLTGEVGIVLEDGEVVKVNPEPVAKAPVATKKKAGAR